MHERVRTVRWSRELFARTVSGRLVGGGAEVKGEDSLPACQQGQATASAAYGRQVAYGGFATQNQTETEPNQKPKHCDAMRCETKRRNATKTNMVFN